MAESGGMPGRYAQDLITYSLLLYGAALSPWSLTEAYYLNAAGDRSGSEASASGNMHNSDHDFKLAAVHGKVDEGAHSFPLPVVHSPLVLMPPAQKEAVLSKSEVQLLNCEVQHLAQIPTLKLSWCLVQRMLLCTRISCERRMGMRLWPSPG